MSNGINEQLLEEVREVNLAYLVLAQHMIRADKAQAMYRLGVSEEVAEVIDQLTPSAGTGAVAGLHANIVIAGQIADVV